MTVPEAPPMRLILDAHTHCGYTVPYENLAAEWKLGGIDGGVVFSPVEEVYDRCDPFFTDSQEYALSRRRVHEYLLERASDRIFPYFFVWNDFPHIPDRFFGIKWHRHADEPVYAYETPSCDRIIEEICEKRLPIVLEEEFRNTLSFIKKIDGRTIVIIPHLGHLNGGYFKLKKAGVFANPHVWADTALAAEWEIEDLVSTYGNERIMFGSDYPFGTPSRERRKIDSLFSGTDLDAILGGNLLHLLGK
jgi:hypothetical protein